MLVVSQQEFKRLDHQMGIHRRLNDENKRIREFHNYRKTIDPEALRKEMERWGIGNRAASTILGGMVNKETIRRWKIPKGRPGHVPCPSWIWIMLTLKIQNPSLAHKLDQGAAVLKISAKDVYKKIIDGEMSTGTFVKITSL